MFKRDMIERALRTFVQAFVPTFTTALVIPGDTWDWAAWEKTLMAAGIAAAAAGLSALTSLWARGQGPNPESASTVV